MLLEDGVEAGEAYLRFGEEGLADPPEYGEGDEGQGQNGQDDQGQAGVGEQEHHQAAHQQDYRLHGHEEPWPTKTHLLHVVGGPDHELPGLGAVVVGERQPLDFGVEIVAEVEGDALGDALRQVALGEGEEPAHGGEHDDEPAGHQQGRLGSVQVAGVFLRRPPGGRQSLGRTASGSWANWRPRCRC